MSGVFQESGGIDFKSATVTGSLTCKFSLNFGPDINGNGHANPP